MTKAWLGAVCALGLASAAVQAQTDAAPAAAPPPKGQVLIQSHGEPPSEEAPDARRPKLPAQPSGPELTDRERAAITFTAYDLDARLTPASQRLVMRAQVTVRNDGGEALERVALQVSSTLTWDSAALVTAGGSTKLELAQHLLDTDIDHTGKASEAILTLPKPLLPGKEAVLDAFYSGTITLSAERLERLGATRAQALDTDWDAIGLAGAGVSTALRGMGDVLWYPVASRQLFLGEGAQLFDAIGRTKEREAGAVMHLRLSVEYVGEAPAAAYFCGRRQALKALSDDAEAPVASGSGVARAEFAAEPLGFRMPSLFVVESPETLTAPLPALAAGSSTSSSSAAPASEATVDSGEAGPPMLAVEGGEGSAVTALADAAERVAPLEEAWLGTPPLSALTVLDHAGQAFEDGPLLVAPVKALGEPGASGALAHSLTHAWVQTGRPWMDEGLAQFFTLLWTEREKGRDAALAALADMMQPVGIAEPAVDADLKKAAPAGEPLVSADSELFFRRKAAAVWWMLRGICGDEALQQALRTWRLREPAKLSGEDDALVFEGLLEKTSGKDLHWFFSDWVLRDRGLPDLSIVDVTPRMLPAGQGHATGWLVSVTVRNDGAAGAEIPVVVRGKAFSATQRLRVPGFGSATARVLLEAEPTEVVVNDGSTPEVRVSRHERRIGEQ